MGMEIVRLFNTLSSHNAYLRCSVTVSNTRCDREVVRMILLLSLEGAVQIDRSKGTSVHVSTCTSHNFNALTPVVWKLWR